MRYTTTSARKRRYLEKQCQNRALCSEFINFFEASFAIEPLLVFLEKSCEFTLGVCFCFFRFCLVFTLPVKLQLLVLHL